MGESMLGRAPGIGVPPLGGVCTYEEAARSGYGVEENVELLRRYNYLLTQIGRVITSHLIATPEWEVKGALSLHLWLVREHATLIRNRVAEMRHPPLRLEDSPDPRLTAFIEELIRSRGTAELLTGLYAVALPGLRGALERHRRETNPLVDHPTRRIFRFILLELEEMLEWGRQALAALTREEADRAAAEAWRSHLEAYLAAAGGVTGREEAPSEPPPPPRAAEPFEPDLEPRRDSRFRDQYNLNFRPHQVYKDRERPAQERSLALACKRLLEMDVPELMAGILVKTPGQPWEYYREMARQIWDEARHSMMGEVALTHWGVDWTRIPLRVNFGLQAKFADPLDCHAVLYTIEQSLMPRDVGKAYEREVCREAGDPLMTLFQDYDWADEVLHVHIGRRWLKPHFPTIEEAQRAAERCATVVEQATQEYNSRSDHHDFWPELTEQLLGLAQAEEQWAHDFKKGVMVTG